jgi:hypothetical protein
LREGAHFKTDGLLATVTVGHRPSDRPIDLSTTSIGAALVSRPAPRGSASVARSARCA